MNLKKFLNLSGFKVALLMTLMVLGIYYLDPHFLTILELKTLDLRFLSRGKVPTSDKVALVTIDEKSLDELGRWPWPRTRMAQLLDALVKAEAGVVGFDQLKHHEGRGHAEGDGVAERIKLAAEMANSRPKVVMSLTERRNLFIMGVPLSGRIN